MLNGFAGKVATRVVARLVPRVRAAWPAIAAIALAVVLAHSGIAHLQAAPELDLYYRTIIGTDEWARTIGIVQLFVAGGLCFRRTRIVTAAAFGVVLVIAAANHWRTDRLGAETLSVALMLVWTSVVAWGEARRGPVTAPKTE